MKLSVIIPILNEEENLPNTLAKLKKHQCEIIVVDGGSEDASPQIARDHGCSLLTSAPGRAGQMNLGAGIAGGDTLLFLHGDTLVPNDFADRIAECLTDPAVALGSFSLGIKSSSKKIALVAYLANLRSKLFHLPYGDQGLFLRKDTFIAAGGFPETPIMEDFIFVRTLAKYGLIRILPQRVITSARRWQNIGVIRTTLINQAIVAGYLLGISPSTLARWYRRNRGVQTRNTLEK